MNNIKNLLNLYKSINNKQATALEFEQAIQEQGLTIEIISLIKQYYPEVD